MAPHKSSALILSTQSFRESSLICTCFSHSHGLFKGIAKGIKSARRNEQSLFERGMLVEQMVYRKPHRELHLLTKSCVVDYFEVTRADLKKTAVRDAAFELIIKTVSADHPHAELFDVLMAFLQQLETGDAAESVLRLTRFYYDFAKHMGVVFDIDECYKCGRLITGGASLSIAEGKCVCEGCLRQRGPNFLPASLISLLTAPSSDSGAAYNLTGKEQMGAARLLADYNAYHAHVSNRFNALDFLASII